MEESSQQDKAASSPASNLQQASPEKLGRQARMSPSSAKQSSGAMEAIAISWLRTAYSRRDDAFLACSARDRWGYSKSTARSIRTAAEKYGSKMPPSARLSLASALDCLLQNPPEFNGSHFSVSLPIPFNLQHALQGSIIRCISRAHGIERGNHVRHPRTSPQRAER